MKHAIARQSVGNRVFSGIMLLHFAFLSVLAPWADAGRMKVGAGDITPQMEAACRLRLRSLGVPDSDVKQILGIEITSSEWECTSCGHTVDGQQGSFPNNVVQCDHCGSPMSPSEGELFRPAPDGKLVLSEAQVVDALAVGDANWTCDHCGAGGNSNRIHGKINLSCGNCGAERVDFDQRPDKNHVGDPTPGKVPAPATTETFSKGQVKRLSIRDRKTQAVLGAGLAAVAGMSAIAWSSLRAKPPHGEITGARWVQTVRVEQFKPVDHKDYKWNIVESAPVMPVNGLGARPGKVITGCNEAQLCTYETFGWQPVDSKVKYGGYDDPIPADDSWARFRIPAHGRQLMNTRFHVDFKYAADGEQGTGEWQPRTEAEFRRFKPGRQIELRLDGLHRPKNAKIRGE